MKKIIKTNLILLLIISGVLLLFHFVLAVDFGMEAVNQGLNGSLVSDDPRIIIGRIINIVLGFLGVIALGIIIYGGFIWMTSNGDSEKIDKAKGILRNGIIGLVIILASWGIATFILSRLSQATTGTNNACDEGSTISCGCGGYMVCQNGSWGGCIGSDCGGGSGPSTCDSSPDPGCQAEQSICAEGYYCDTDCNCQLQGNIGDPCDGDPSTPTCEVDNDKCSSYLTCNVDTCTCYGPPVITNINPVGGFCQEDFNKSCFDDDDCNTICNTNIPNGAPDNFITILGKNFGEYETGKSKVIFVGLNNSVEGKDVTDINPNCINTWTDNQIIIAVPLGAESGAIKVINKDNLSDQSNDDYGPVLPDFIVNNIVRPGLCTLTPSEGKIITEVNYQGVNLYNGIAYFGNYESNVHGLDSNFNNPSGLSGKTLTPNIQKGVSSSFVVNNINNNEERSNYLYYNKLPEDGDGPYIISFSPTSGAPGQYVAITGSGFGGAKGNHKVYFGDVEASYNFPTICANSVWNNNQIIVKVPENIEEGMTFIKIDLGDKIIDTSKLNPNKFEVDKNLTLKSSLCKIEPDHGPTESDVTVYGEYFGQVGQDGVVQFNPSLNVYDIIKNENEADYIETTVPQGALTGPVKIIKDGQWGNELNFEVGSCSVDDDCGSQVCCPQNTYKKGQCVNDIENCFVDVPTSVFEWQFDTEYGNGGNHFYSCEDMADDYGACQTGVFCPNVPGVCSPYAGGQKVIVGYCDYSCASIDGCGSLGLPLCNYDSDLNKCVQTGSSGLCDLSQEITYTLGEQTYTAIEFCNSDGYWEITVNTSCPENWTKYNNRKCVNENETCSFCSGDLSCQKVGEEARCVSNLICQAGAVCEDNSDPNVQDDCVMLDNASCDCCCRINHSSEDCCSPLECTGICGEDTSDDGVGYGRCSGCADVGTTTEEHDAACNCLEHTGQYCDINQTHPEGICVDCNNISNKESCNDHSSVCCFDSNKTSDPSDDSCRGGSGELISNDPNNVDYGYCAYYNCQDPSTNPPGDPALCATSTPVKLGVFDNISTCEDRCSGGTENSYCSTFNGDVNACIAETECCFDNDSGDCYSGKRINGGTYNGYCAYYNCQEADPTQCDSSNPVISGTYHSISSCTLGCVENGGGVAQYCNPLQGGQDDSCNFDVCDYPGFACLDESGDLGVYPTCGVCCCNPSQPEACQTPEAPDLYCKADQSPCEGENRGLCCGCVNDNECGNIATVGCGFDTCCRARPNELSTSPEENSDDVCRNASIKVDFDQILNQNSVVNNVLLLEEHDYGNGVCPSGTFVAQFKVHKESLFVRLINRIKTIFNIKQSSVLANESDSNKLYCSVPGLASVDIEGEKSSIVFVPQRLLDASTNYYFIVKGDEELNSKMGVLSINGIGFNGLGLKNDSGDYVEASNYTFNGKIYPNSFILHFSTLSDQGSMAGVCAIDSVSVKPDSYLFNRLDNDIHEKDVLNDPSFDTVADGDKLFSVYAYSTDNQLLHPVTGYFWNWSWDIDQSVANFVNLLGLNQNNQNNKFVRVNDGLTDAETLLNSSVNMDNFIGNCDSSSNCVCDDNVCSNHCCNIYSNGNGMIGRSNIYVFICDNPWPQVQPDGTWNPWEDNCQDANGNCADFNYKFYYCRDNGNKGTFDDLPSIINNAVINGQNNILLCSADNTPCNMVGQVCGPDSDGDGSPDGICVWSVLKESYFFRENVLSAPVVNNVSDDQIGGRITVFWQSQVDQVKSYKVYYNIEGQNTMFSKEVNIDDACSISGGVANCSTSISGLNNEITYEFKVSVISVNNTESKLSNSKTAVPTDKTPPPIPYNLQVNNIDSDEGTITFIWNYVNGSGDTFFNRLYHGLQSDLYGESFDSQEGASSITLDLNHFNSGTHYFAVSSVDQYNNESNKSSEIQVNLN